MCAFQLPYQPNRYPRATLFIRGGKLRPLPAVLLSLQHKRYLGRKTPHKPLGRKSPWLPFMNQAIYVNGYQKRRRKAVFDNIRALWKKTNQLK